MNSRDLLFKIINNNCKVNSLKENDMNELTQVKNVKFTDEQIDKFFKKLNSNKMIRELCHMRQELKPIRLSDFTKPNEVRKLLKSDKINAMCIINCGSVYENYPKNPRSAEQRLENGKKDVQILIDAIEKVITSMTRPFNTLKVELMNNELTVCRTKIDKYDDGADEYGMEVFLKIHY